LAHPAPPHGTVGTPLVRCVAMFSARELAALMGPEVPTAEQELIIEGEPGGTFRIVAGAGSGKNRNNGTACGLADR